jgi:hypothetical protein
MAWPTGIRVNWQGSATGMRGVEVQSQRRLDLVWSQRPHAWATLETGLHRTQHGGSLYQKLYDPQDTAGLPFWGPGDWWWHAAIGVPGLKWELSLANRAFPEFYWLDSKASDAVSQRMQGNLIRHWESQEALSGNLAQALHAKFGVLRYSAHFDSDVYRTPVQQILFEDLPAPFGPWGFGFVLGGKDAQTRLWMDLFPLTLGIPSPRSHPTRVRFGFLRLDLSYRNKQSFHLSVATSVGFDNPVLRWPGAKS